MVLFGMLRRRRNCGDGSNEVAETFRCLANPGCASHTQKSFVSIRRTLDLDSMECVCLMPAMQHHTATVLQVRLHLMFSFGQVCPKCNITLLQCRRSDCIDDDATAKVILEDLAFLADREKNCSTKSAEWDARCKVISLLSLTLSRC